VTVFSAMLRHSFVYLSVKCVERYSHGPNYFEFVTDSRNQDSVMDLGNVSFLNLGSSNYFH
jgi:hypothetical protein